MSKNIVSGTYGTIYFISELREDQKMNNQFAMEKCRICLGKRKNMTSIYETCESHSNTYKAMITAIANVKIIKDKRITYQICRSCRLKLTDAYELKGLIERSDLALNEAINCKKINFDNINDIQNRIEIKPFVPKLEDTKEYFMDGVNEMCYSNTLIKKVEPSIDDDFECNKPIPVLEFLKSIKSEDNADYDMGSYSPESDDEDYIPPYPLMKTEKVKKKYKCKGIKKKKATKTSNTKSNDKKENFKIKPVYLNDLKLVYGPPVRTVRNKEARAPKLEMCPYCGKMTKSLKPHLLQHTGERKFKCDQCVKAFFTSKMLEDHKKTHSNIRNFKCDHCVATFIDKGGLNSHMVMHIGEKKFICSVCNKAFLRKAALSRHKLSHNSANKNIMCELCNMSFFTKYGLRHHYRIHTGERPYKCEICSQPYSYKHDFNRHCYNKHGVFLKRRSIYVMNEEVLERERALMRNLMLRVQGIVQDGEPVNPFEGPQAAQAFEQTVKALECNQIPIDITNSKNLLFNGRPTIPFKDLVYNKRAKDQTKH